MRINITLHCIIIYCLTHDVSDLRMVHNLRISIGYSATAEKDIYIAIVNRLTNYLIIKLVKLVQTYLISKSWLEIREKPGRRVDCMHNFAPTIFEV